MKVNKVNYTLEPVAAYPVLDQSSLEPGAAYPEREILRKHTLEPVAAYLVAVTLSRA